MAETITQRKPDRLQERTFALCPDADEVGQSFQLSCMWTLPDGSTAHFWLHQLQSKVSFSINDIDGDDTTIEMSFDEFAEHMLKAKDEGVSSEER